MTTQDSSKSKWRFFSSHDTAQPGPIVLDRRHIYILPSKAGLGFGLVLFIMLLGSINYNNSMGYALTFLLASVGIVSILHTHRTLLGLRIEAGKVHPVFAGETAQFQLWLDNHGQAARYVLVWQRDDSTFVIDVPADQHVGINIPVSTAQRGRAFLGRVMVHSHFPLGLFRAWSYVHLDVSTLVYPQPFGHKTLPLGEQSDNVGEGSFREGGGEDFIGYRDYQLGDSPRHIDWKAVARGQNWIIKQFGGLRAATVWLTWDDVSVFNNVELALSQLCLWILVAESQGAEYGLKIPGCTLEPNRGNEHRELCLEALALHPLSKSEKT